MKTTAIVTAAVQAAPPKAAISRGRSLSLGAQPRLAPIPPRACRPQAFAAHEAASAQPRPRSASPVPAAPVAAALVRPGASPPPYIVAGLGDMVAMGAEKEPPLSARKRLGLLSQKIKPKVGKTARRSLRYGMYAGSVLSSMAAMAAPVLAPFFVVAAVAVGAAVPALLLLGVLVGAVVEALARKVRVKTVDEADILALESIYTELKERKQLEGKLPPDDNLAWHKVNAMLSELSGGFWRAMRLMAHETLGIKPSCGRYEVGTILRGRRPAASAAAVA